MLNDPHQQATGRLLGGGWRGHLARRLDAVLAAVHRTPPASRPLPGGPLGPVPLEHTVDVIGGLELLGHTWDLARATGGDDIRGLAYQPGGTLAAGLME